MLVSTVRYLAVVLAALTLGIAFGHLLEIDGKLRLDGATWLAVQQQLYAGSGAIGLSVQFGAAAAAALLAWLLRHRYLVLGLTLAATICLIAQLGVWVLVNEPIDSDTARWTAQTLPANWQDYRNAWEAAHVSRAGLNFLALTALVVGLLVEGHRAPAHRLVAERSASARATGSY
jgi:hypothetical protein